MTTQSKLDRYPCRLELVFNGEGIKESLGKHSRDENFIEVVKLYLLTHNHLDLKSELAFDCLEGRRNYDSGKNELHDDEARFVFKLTIINKKAFTGNID